MQDDEKVKFVDTYSQRITPFSSDRRKSFEYANFLPETVFKRKIIKSKQNI